MQSRLAGGVVSALTRAGDVAALEAGGGHVVKARRRFFKSPFYVVVLWRWKLVI